MLLSVSADILYLLQVRPEKILSLDVCTADSIPEVYQVYMSSFALTVSMTEQLGRSFMNYNAQLYSWYAAHAFLQSLAV